MDPEVRQLIRRMAFENPTWGSPRIHSELLKLGFVVSERTVARYMPKRREGPDALKRWMTFIRNHREGIAAMDFFVVSTATFRVLYVLFVIHHGRRQIVHFAVTENPTLRRDSNDSAEREMAKYASIDSDRLISPGKEGGSADLNSHSSSNCVISDCPIGSDLVLAKDSDDIRPAVVACDQTFGTLLGYHPHQHLTVGDSAFTSTGEFVSMPRLKKKDVDGLTEALRRRVPHSAHSLHAVTRLMELTG